MTIADDQLTVRLTRDMWRLEQRHVDRLGHGSTVWMQELDPAKPLRHPMHVDVSYAPAGWILADRAGNRVSVAALSDPVEPFGDERTE